MRVKLCIVWTRQFVIIGKRKIRLPSSKNQILHAQTMCNMIQYLIVINIKLFIRDFEINNYSFNEVMWYSTQCNIVNHILPCIIKKAKLKLNSGNGDGARVKQYANNSQDVFGFRPI